MYQYPYLEQFYRDNYSKLLDWSSPLRPSKSCPKNGAAGVAKFVDFYKKTHALSFTEDEVLTILNAETVSDGDTIFHQNLRVMRELKFVLPPESGSKKYTFTEEFVAFVESNHSVDYYIIEKLMSIASVDDLTMYFNFLICVMREAALYGQVIQYRDAADKFTLDVPDAEKRKEHQKRVYRVYGFKGDEARTVPENYTPNISYFCHAVLRQLGILAKSDVRIDNMGTLVLTPLGEIILGKIDENLREGKGEKQKRNQSERHSSEQILFQFEDATKFVWECIKLFNKNKELKLLLSSDYRANGGSMGNYLRINGCFVAQLGQNDMEGYESIYTDEEGYINNGFDARDIEQFADAINDVYKGKYKVEVAPNLYKLYKIQETKHIEPKIEKPVLISQDYQYMSAIKTKPFLILGGFSGTGKSIAVKSLAFSTCPCDGVLNSSETSPGNYLLLSVKPNWHDATDITGFRSSVNRNYYVTDFMRFVVKAKLYEKQNVPFFVCLDEMNLAPVEEYFADFLSVIESRTKKEDRTITTDPLIPASVFNDAEYADDFNIFLSLGIHPTEPVKDITEFNARIKESDEDAFYQEQWLVEELKQHGMTIPQNLVVIGTVNMDDTTNSFSRKVIDRAMTFETVVGEFSVDGYFGDGAQLLMEYCSNPVKGELYISDEIRATDLENDYLTEEEKTRIIGFINNINEDLKGTPFQISYRVLNETILLYRSKKEINRIVKGKYEEGVDFSLDLNNIFDDILMQKILPRIEGDYDKCHTAIAKLSKRAQETGWTRSIDKLEFMEQRFGNDKSGFTSFWN